MTRAPLTNPRCLSKLRVSRRRTPGKRATVPPPCHRKHEVCREDGCLSWQQARQGSKRVTCARICPHGLQESSRMAIGLDSHLIEGCSSRVGHREQGAEHAVVVLEVLRQQHTLLQPRGPWPASISKERFKVRQGWNNTADMSEEVQHHRISSSCMRMLSQVNAHEP